jgi:regulator of replication initiation timing
MRVLERLFWRSERAGRPQGSSLDQVPGNESQALGDLSGELEHPRSGFRDELAVRDSTHAHSDNSGGTGTDRAIPALSKRLSGGGGGGASGESTTMVRAFPEHQRLKAFQELECLAFDEKGNFERRAVSRLELLRAARSVQSALIDYPPLLSDSGDDLSQEQIAKLMKRRQKRIHEYRQNFLQIRDLRQIDPSFASKTALWVRQNVLIISLLHIRALIFADRLLLFDPDAPEVQETALVIRERLRSVPVDRDVYAPFEFRALEACFICVCNALERELGAFEPYLMQLLEDLSRESTMQKIESLRMLKLRLNGFLAKAQDIRQTLKSVLDEDEDMARLYLTELRKQHGKPRTTEDHEAAEQLLESYLQLVDHVHNRAELLDAATSDTEDLLSIQLDAMRNRLLVLDMSISVVTGAFSWADVVIGLFHMNLQLPIYGENGGSVGWFIGVVFVMLAWALLLVAIMFTWIRRSGLWHA